MEMAFQNKVSWKMEKLCCQLDLNTASRIIGCFGVILSVAMINILVKDTIESDFNVSRQTAHALGLDWQHIHPAANVTQTADPNGKLISSMIMTYAVIYALINLLLILGTILNKIWCTFPWILVELFGWFSKIIALSMHLRIDPQDQSTLFIIGSSLYIVIIFWLLLVVIATAISWGVQRSVELIDEGPIFNLQRSNRITMAFDGFDSTRNDAENQSPKPYKSTTYAEI